MLVLELKSDTKIKYDIKVVLKINWTRKINLQIALI